MEPPLSSLPTSIQPFMSCPLFPQHNPSPPGRPPPLWTHPPPSTRGHLPQAGMVPASLSSTPRGALPHWKAAPEPPHQQVFTYHPSSPSPDPRLCLGLDGAISQVTSGSRAEQERQAVLEVGAASRLNCPPELQVSCTRVCSTSACSLPQALRWIAKKKI
jgi:hypothetical protein